VLPTFFSSTFFRSVTNIFSRQHFSEVCHHFLSSTFSESAIKTYFQHFSGVLLTFSSTFFTSVFKNVIDIF
jgi:hypothetical protein